MRNRNHIMLSTVALLFSACQNWGEFWKVEHAETTEPPCSHCRIFVTAATYTGDLGGVAGADEKCLRDSANPAGAGKGRWKAMLDAELGRRACLNSPCSENEHIDWVLRPLTPYFQATGITEIAATNAQGVFAFNLTNPLDPMQGYIWTGLQSNWISSPGFNCDNWTNGSATARGSYGHPSGGAGTSSVNIAYSDSFCSSQYNIYCAEQ